MSGPNDVQSTAPGTQPDSNEGAAPSLQSGRGRTLSGQTVTTVSSSKITNLARDSGGIGGNSHVVSDSARKLSSDTVQHGTSVSKSQDVSKLAKVALNNGALKIIYTNPDEMDEGQVDDLFDAFKELSNSQEISGKDITDAQNTDFLLFFDNETEEISIENLDSLEAIANKDKAFARLRNDGKADIKNEYYKTLLLSRLSDENIKFGDSISEEEKAEILSALSSSEYIVVGDEEWERILAITLLTKVISKIEIIKKDNLNKVGSKKQTVSLSNNFNFFINLNNKYMNKFSIIVSNLFYNNKHDFNLQEITSNILKHISEMNEDLKDEERRELLSKLRKEANKLYDLKKSYLKLGVTKNRVFYKGFQSISRYLLIKDIEIKRMLGINSFHRNKKF